MMLLPLVASAQEKVEIDGIYYKLISNGKVAEVTSNPNKYIGSLIIPEKVVFKGMDYSVTAIGHSAFDGCDELISVILPNGVLSIGYYAFASCSGLTSITIPNSVTSIGEWAFQGCTALTQINIPNSVKSIRSHTFQWCI